MSDSRNVHKGDIPVYRQVQSLKTQLVGNGIAWLDDFAPSVHVSRRSYGRDKSKIMRVVFDPTGIRTQYLSAAGTWDNTLGRNIFPFEEAQTLARTAMQELATTAGLDSDRVVVEEVVLQETISPMTDLQNYVTQNYTLHVRSAVHGYTVQNYDGKYLSKSGQWHTLGTSDRFIRNHYFAYDEAIERALEALPHVVFHARVAGGERVDMTFAEHRAYLAG